MQRVKTRHVIIESLLIGCHFVLPNVSTDNQVLWTLLQSLHCVLHSSVIESHAVDHPLVFRKSEKSWLRVAVLTDWRQRSNLNKSKTQRFHLMQPPSILVKSSG